jgi:hypothetical protein
MSDSESDVSKALAAFGAPPLKYRSFTHAPIQPPIEPEPEFPAAAIEVPPEPPRVVAPPPPPPPPAPAPPAWERLQLPAETMPAPAAPLVESFAPADAAPLPDVSSDMVAPETAMPVPAETLVAPAQTDGVEDRSYAPPGRLMTSRDLPLTELFRILASRPPPAPRPGAASSALGHGSRSLG